MFGVCLRPPCYLSTVYVLVCAFVAAHVYHSVDGISGRCLKFVVCMLELNRNNTHIESVVSMNCSLCVSLTKTMPLLLNHLNGVCKK